MKNFYCFLQNMLQNSIIGSTFATQLGKMVANFYKKMLQ